MWNHVIVPLSGGALIGLASALLLLLSGRIAGISGILNGMLVGPEGERGWRLAFALGLIAGGALMAVVLPSAFAVGGLGSPWLLAPAGLLVGFGAQLGSGCTSGHGVCGIGRLSVRSLSATLTFIATGALTVFAAEHLL
ncbi:MAG: YeeE/YedE family protein [Myxococcota bacterium]